MHWTLDLLKVKGRDFTFFSETNPNHVELIEGEVVEFRNGYAHTDNPVVAYELLLDPHIQPGQWEKEADKYIEMVMQQEAQAATGEADLTPEEVEAALAAAKKRKAKAKK